MNSYSSPSLGQVSASSLHEAARLLAGRAATAKYGRNGRVVSCHAYNNTGPNSWAEFYAIIGADVGRSQIDAKILHFTVEMVGKPTP
jgi:hypothetical protein